MRHLNRIIFLVLFLGSWRQPLSAQTANPGQYKYVFTVAKDGTGDFTFIQDAINAMRGFPLAPITLYIKNGVYKEKILLPANNTDVTFIGESVDSTIITFSDYSGDGVHGTFSSYTVKISGNRFVAENITFANEAGRVGQAVALFVDADQVVFRNCKFLGNQDTVYTGGENTRQYFFQCYIEGTTDFIFGPATAVFDRCHIHAKTNSYITAANTPKGKKYGMVFLDCRITTDPSVTKLYLGRPWRAYSNTVFLRCELPAPIAPAGWDNWGNPENEKTVTYAEYRNTGPGAITDKRVAWSKQLSNKEARKFTLEHLLSNETILIPDERSWYMNNGTKPFDATLFTAAKPEVWSLYPGDAPNSLKVPNEEKAVTHDNVTRVSKVSQPTLIVYKPSRPNGRSIIICPGGGYGILAIDKEGTRLAEVFNSWGITAFVLKYRLPDPAYCKDPSIAPLQDAQQAMRMVRSRAKELGIDPLKVGIMGFSAGGHLAATATTHFDFKADPQNMDTTSVRPDFALLIYPVISFDETITHMGSRTNLIGKEPNPEAIQFFSNEKQVGANTPPVFLVHAGDDGAVPVENSLRFYQACILYKVPAEMHLYPKGGHGFGMYNTTTRDNWMDRLQTWLLGLK